MAETNGGYQAIVERIVRNGKHGPYAVASSDFGPITFSLDDDVWQEKDWPEPGHYVILSGVTGKRAGWRAQLGRFVRPDDQKPNSTEQQGTEQ